MSKFAEMLKKLMEERRVTAKVLSDATGIPASTISEWTSGRNPKLGNDLVKVGRFFGVSLEYLATGENPEESLIKDLLETASDEFLTVHRGVYRLKVEKYVGSGDKKK